MLSTASLNSTSTSTWTGGSGDTKSSARRHQRKPSKIKCCRQRVVQERHNEDHNCYCSTDHPSSKLIQVVKSTQCNQFTVNYQTLDYKLSCVADCLVHLNTEHTTDINHQPRESPYPQNRRDNSQLNNHNSCNILIDHQPEIDDGKRIKRSVGIYRILLKLLPLEAHLELDSTAMAPRNELAKLFRERHFNPLDARQQVLDLIERQLNGYCDSIDRLRCILRSDTMLAAIGAFETIVRNIIIHNEERLREDLLNNQSAVDRGKFEFRIVQEWRV